MMPTSDGRQKDRTGQIMKAESTFMTQAKSVWHGDHQLPAPLLSWVARE